MFFFFSQTNIIEKNNATGVRDILHLFFSPLEIQRRFYYLSSVFVENQSTNTYNMRSIGGDCIRGVRDPWNKHQVLRLCVVISKPFLKKHKQINNLLQKSQQTKQRQDLLKSLTLTAGSTRLANPRGSFIQIPFFPCKFIKLTIRTMKSLEIWKVVLMM